MRRPWIREEDFHNFHWTKKTSSKRGDEKLGEEGVWGSSSCVIFLGKGRRRLMNFSRWWKEGKWVGCLGYFKRIKVSRIVLKA
jgi:hypothetical protein